MSVSRYAQLYLTPGDDGRAALLAFARTARRSIHLNIYGFTDPELVRVLLAHRAAGRVVAVVADHTQAAGPTERPRLQALVDGGVELVITESPAHRIDHEKVLLVDAIDGPLADSSAVAYGSYNFSVGAQEQRNVLRITNDPGEVARLWADWQASHDYGAAHHPDWQLTPGGPP